jgi:hypothetical protein
MNLSAIIQLLTFLVDHKDEIKSIVLQIQTLIPDAPGTEKAAIVKSFISKALGIEATIESVWPMVAPVFNLIVAAVKAKMPTTSK